MGLGFNCDMVLALSAESNPLHLRFVRTWPVGDLSLGESAAARIAIAVADPNLERRVIVTILPVVDDVDFFQKYVDSPLLGGKLVGLGVPAAVLGHQQQRAPIVSLGLEHW